MADNVIVRVPEQQFIRGEDGYSPEVTIEDIAHGHSVTITDRDHPTGQSFNVMDGASAYEQAVAGGYTKSEAQFNAELGSFGELSEQAADSAAASAQSESNAAGSAMTATTKAQEAADSAAQALIRMNSAATSAQAAEDASSFFTSTILPNAVTTINNTRDQAVANVNVAKSTAVQNVQAEGATQISAVQTESATQQAAIEQKGEDVLDSIPADYTTLSGDVDDLKSALGQSLIHVVRISAKWEQGNIATSTGANSDLNYDYRCRTSNDFRMAFPNVINGTITVKGPTGYWVSWRKYSKDTYIGASENWMELPATFEVEQDYVYRFCLKKVVDDADVAISPTDFTRYAITFEYDTADANQDIVTRNNPVEMDEKFQQLTRKTRVDSTTFGTKPLCLLHFSDVHGDLRCLKNIVEFRNHYAKYIDDVIHSGDTVTSDSASGTRFWAELDGAEKILNVIGNHDTRVGGVWTGLSMQESYDSYFAPYIENWNVNYTAGKTYYYKDYTEEQVRLIVLDIMHQEASQLSWFASVLSDALSNNLHVIVFAHSRASWKLDPYDSAWDDCPIGGGYPDSLADSSAFTGSSYPSNIAQEYVDSVDSFINNGGNFVCWAHGHTHYKIFATITDHPNQLNIAVGNAGDSPYARNSIQARQENTKTMDNFNVIAIDTTAKNLRVSKVGVSYDKFMRKCDTLCWDYGNSALMYPHDTHGIEITEQPTNISGPIGGTGTLKVSAIGDGLRYQWQYKKPNESSYTTASSADAKNPEWLINITTNTNGRTYRCVVTNAHGSKRISGEAVVTAT